MKTAAIKVPASYSRLHAEFPLRPIRSRADYHRAAGILDKLAVKDDSDLDEGESDYLETLSLLIAAYDREHFPIPTTDATPVEILRFLMEQSGAKQSEIAQLLSITPSAISMILSGDRPITADHARRLADHFRVDPGLFI